MKNYIAQITNYLASVKQMLDLIDPIALNTIMNVLEDARKHGRQIFIMGNGGSAATASHFVCDFNKGISEHLDKRYKFICLNDNVPIMMAYANDYTYEDIFEGQLKNFLQIGDIVIALSGSGNSKNIVKATSWAKSNGGVVISFTGFDGGKLKQMADYAIHVPINDMQVTEDLHMILDHCMMKVLSTEICK